MGFYDEIITKLKEEAKCLNDRLKGIRECKNPDHMNNYIATLKSLRETLDLIVKYDWQLMYSAYGVTDKDIISSAEDVLTEISIWEQNHEGQIRNHKVWKTNIPYNYKNDLSDVKIQ
jgi:hypothetical protein